MIVSASYRSDIPAFYGTWFLRRLAAGYALVVNPYSGSPYRVDLRPGAVDGFVLWTKNLRPFRDSLDTVRRVAPFVLQVTITGYPRALESHVIDPDRAVADLRAAAESFGAGCVVWRYDPILITDLTPAGWHLDRFARLAHALQGATDEAVTSFAHFYQKTRRNLMRHKRAWHDPEPEAKRDLLNRMAGIAAENGMTLSLCSQPDYLIDGVQPARCVDAARLSRVAGQPIAARDKGNRPGCACAESRDIGAYDSCPHGCVYCYAVRDRALARRSFARHDPESEFLIPPTNAGISAA